MTGTGRAALSARASCAARSTGFSAKAHPTVDIRHLTLAEAGAIYWAEYCHGPGFNRLAPALCLTVFDAGVNCGPARARAWLATVAVHGTEADQIRAYSALDLAYHKRLKSWPRYHTVWSGRIARCEAQAMRLLASAPHLAPPRVTTPSAASPCPAPRAAAEPLVHPFIAWLARLLLAITIDPAKA